MENNIEVETQQYPRAVSVEEGEHCGIKYRIKRIELSPFHRHHTGYIYWTSPVSEDEARKLNVHGGVTYNDEQGCIGFDCAHFGDNIQKCDVNFVREECKSLIEQLKKNMSDFVPAFSDVDFGRWLTSEHSVIDWMREVKRAYAHIKKLEALKAKADVLADTCLAHMLKETAPGLQSMAKSYLEAAKELDNES